jgi:hypothetical protein
MTHAVDPGANTPASKAGVGDTVVSVLIRLDLLDLLDQLDLLTAALTGRERAGR